MNDKKLFYILRLINPFMWIIAGFFVKWSVPENIASTLLFGMGFGYIFCWIFGFSWINADKLRKGSEK